MYHYTSVKSIINILLKHSSWQVPRLFQVFGIQALQLRQNKEAVFSNQNIVEIDLTATVCRGLDAYQIPVHGGFIAVITVVIATARRKVK